MFVSECWLETIFLLNVASNFMLFVSFINLFCTENAKYALKCWSKETTVLVPQILVLILNMITKFINKNCDGSNYGSTGSSKNWDLQKQLVLHVICSRILNLCEIFWQFLEWQPCHYSTAPFWPTRRRSCLTDNLINCAVGI